MYNRFPKNGQDFLASYNGPYPLHQLKNARDTLIYGFNTYNSHTFHRLYQLMCIENYSNDLNYEYSEDNYTESESENESGVRPKLIPDVVGTLPARDNDLFPKRKAEVNDDESESGEQPKVTKPEAEVKTQGEQSTSVTQSQETEVSEKTFYSAEGFKNRFAEYLFGKTTVGIFNKVIEKTSDTTRKSPDKKNEMNGESYKVSIENGDLGETDCHPSSEAAKITNLGLTLNEDKLIECFKCDYCHVTSMDTQKMYYHLNTSQHRYGSKCLGKVENDNISPCYTVEEMYVQSEGKRCTKIASCPTCFAMFPSIYSCASHSQKCLASSGRQQNGTYAISDVVRDTEILVPVDSVCQACKLRCSKHRALNLHYEACQHYPFDKPKTSDILLCFICPYCKKDFDSFFPAKSHVISHAVKQPRVSMALQLLYYKKTLGNVNRLLPMRRSLPPEKKKNAVYKRSVYKNSIYRNRKRTRSFRKFGKVAKKTPKGSPVK